jgi:hypothetical protein
MASKHPELFWEFNAARLCRFSDSILLRPVWITLWKFPALSEPPATFLRLIGRILLAANMQRLFWKLEAILHGHAYWRGVVAALGKLSNWERLAQDAPHELPDCHECDFDISVDLENIDEFVHKHWPIDALRVFAAGQPLGKIAADATAEPLRMIHIQGFLVSRFGAYLLAELATRNQRIPREPVMSPSEPLPILKRDS